MNIERDKPGIEDEVFEIGDFTVVTPLEQFTTLIEVALQDWELTGKRAPRSFNKIIAKSMVWGTKSKILKFHNSNQLCMTHYYPILDEPFTNAEISDAEQDKAYLNEVCHDMMSPHLDFVFRSNITTMYGVSEFVVLSPVDPHDDNIGTEDDVQYLRSACRCAALSCGSSVPMFIQFSTVDRQLFFGVAVDNDTTISFESALLRRGQAQHMNMTGLIGLFKSHVQCPSTPEVSEIKVSIQFEFEQKKFSGVGIFNSDVASVPFKLDTFSVGSRKSPLQSVHLMASWPNHGEDVLIENNLYSDLDPMNAFEWSFLVKFEPVVGEMSQTLGDMLKLNEAKIGKKRSYEVLGLNDVLGPVAFSQLADRGSVRNIQIGSSPSITNPTGLANDFALMPMDDEEMSRWINAVFRFTHEADEFHNQTDATLKDKLKFLCNNANAAPLHSTCSRLSLAFYHLSMNDVHPRHAHVQLWMQFVKELRKRFNNGEDVTDAQGIVQPNMLSCYLNQKIEMLQCCINARRQRHQWYNSAQQFGNDEDEFFDAEDSMEWMDGYKNDTAEKQADSNGKLGRFGDMCLIDHPETPLFEFITQNACPMTDDMAQAHQEYLESLSEQERVHAQLATLISDMQAFKAANPLGQFADFIRWHSPKDWIEEEKRISDRFQLPDNVWFKCWEDASPVPVFNQARLFNETSVAEEILSALEEAPVAKVGEWLQPTLFTSLAVQLLQDGFEARSLYDESKLIDSVVAATRSKNRDDYLEALRELKKLEKNIMMYKSLEETLRSHAMSSGLVEPPTTEQLSELTIALIEDWRMRRKHNEFNVVSEGVPITGAANSAFGDTIHRIMVITGGKDDSKMPKPVIRQYVFRWSVPRPFEGSRLVPQRMFVSLEDEEFRLAGSFSEDALFS